MTQTTDAALVEVRKSLGITDDDNYAAVGDDLEWLMRQLGQWPTRVHPDNTTNARFLMQSAALTLHAQARRVEECAGLLAAVVNADPGPKADAAFAAARAWYAAYDALEPTP